MSDDRMERLRAKYAEFAEAHKAEAHKPPPKKRVSRPPTPENQLKFPIGADGIRHGSTSAVRWHKCKCGVCRAAERERQRDYWRRRKEAQGK